MDLNLPCLPVIQQINEAKLLGVSVSNDLCMDAYIKFILEMRN
jgi:hypothetical protein